MTLLKAGLSCCSLFVTFSLWAQEGEQIFLKDVKNLDSLSNIYLELGNAEFLVIEAYKADVIKSGEKYVLEYRGNVFTLNGEPVAEALQSSVVKKLEERNSRHDAKTTSLQVNSGDKNKGGIYIHAPISDADFVLGPSRESLAATYKLAHMLLGDQLIRGPQEVEIAYNADYIKVNGAKIPDNLQRKYRSIISIAAQAWVLINFTSYSTFSFIITEEMLKEN